MRKIATLIGLFVSMTVFAQTLPKGMINLTGSDVTTTIDAKGNAAKKNMAVVNDKIFFTASNAAAGEELWITDGTVAGTKMVKDINPGADGSNPSYLCAVGGKVYFSATTPETGAELWVSDGTDAGTKIAADVYIGSESSKPMNLTAMGGDKSLVVFAATDENSVLDNKAWIYLFDSNTGKLKLLGKEQPMLTGDSYYGFFVPFQDTKVFFAAVSDTYGVELFMADTTANSVKIVKDIMDTPAPGKPAGSTIGGNLQWISNYKDSLIVFRTTTPTKYSETPSDYTDNIGEEIWFTDGITTTFLGDLNPSKNADGVGNGTQFAWTVVYNGKFYFRADAGSGLNVELYTTNFKGLDGTHLVKDFNPGADPSWAQWYAHYKGDLFFMANEGATGAGADLQYMTPTQEPSLFFDVVPGNGSSWLEQLTTVKTKEGKDTLLFFVAPSNDKELWIVSGLNKKAAPIGDMGPGSTNPFDLTPLNSALYFTTGTYPSLFKYQYTPVFNISANLLGTLDESKDDTASFRLTFINPEGINPDAPWVNFSIQGDWKISMGGDDPYANTKRLYVSDFQNDLDTVINVLIGTLVPNAWSQTLKINCTFLNTDGVVDTVKVTSSWKTEPAFTDKVLFYVRPGDFTPTTLNPKFEALGTMQSKTDQVYGNDTLANNSIVKWGRSGEIGGVSWWDADRFTNFIWTKNGPSNHLMYSFPLETGKYHLLMALTSAQWTQSRPFVLEYPGFKGDMDINDKLIIIDKIIDYTKGTDTTFNISFTSTLNSGLVIGGFMKIAENVPTSVNGMGKNTSEFSVFPNPSSGFVNINRRGNLNATRYEVINLTGKSLKSGSINSDNTEINLGGLTNGLYFIKIYGTDVAETFKVLLNK